MVSGVEVAAITVEALERGGVEVRGGLGAVDTAYAVEEGSFRGAGGAGTVNFSG